MSEVRLIGQSAIDPRRVYLLNFLLIIALL